MVRDEEDIVRYTVQHMLRQLDLVVVLDNLSTDRTPVILKDIAATDDRLVVLPDDELAYRQAEKINAVAEEFCRLGDWVVAFDADETWWNLAELDKVKADVVECAVRRFIPTPCDSINPNPLERITRYVPGDDGAKKVCYRWQPDTSIHQGAHDVDHPGTRQHGPVLVHHYQYRTREQARRKVLNGAQAYEASGLPHSVGFHWRDLAAINDEQFEAWWHNYTNTPGLLEDQR